MSAEIRHWNTLTLPDPETVDGAQAKADAARDEAISVAAQDATAKANAAEANAKAYADAKAADALDQAKQYADNLEISWEQVADKPVQATRWPSWSEVTGKPSTFPPSAHTHGASDLPEATTSAKGIVQLSNSTSSTSETVAATARAVKSAFDRALEAEANAKAYADAKFLKPGEPQDVILLRNGTKVFELSVDADGSLVTTQVS